MLMMRRFDYFLFENFDADEQAWHPGNPRRILTSQMDGVLSMVAEGCSWVELRERWGEERVRQAAECGVLRRAGEEVRFDSPVFLREDAAALTGAFERAAEELASRLEEIWPELKRLAEKLHNGFDPSFNLYHLVCGMTLDGSFFDALERAGAVATARQHPSGLDYIAVIYERCAELDGLSRRLLCSWNRAVGETCALQSFGDADGDRFDAYRWYRLREGGRLPARFAALDVPDRERLTSEARRLAETGACAQDCLKALEAFGYAADGRMAVPVYRAADEGVIRSVSAAVTDCLLEPIATILRDGVQEITPARHGVRGAETANELYHLLFGQLNETLARRGMVAAPPHRPGEGRYWQSVILT